MKKAESGSNVKTKKVEITISVDGVAIQVSIDILNINLAVCLQIDSEIYNLFKIVFIICVKLKEPRGTKILHQFPLHNISYCADEKGVKKFFR